MSTNEFVRFSPITNVRLLVFYFYFIFRLGTYTRLFLSQISPWSSNPRNFSNVRPNLVKQRQNLPLEPLFLVNQLEHGFDNLKFGCKQIWIWTSFDRSLSFVAPIQLILFANRRSAFELSVWIFYLEFYPCILCLSAYVCYCLFAIEFPECEACYYESLGFSYRQQGK